MPSLILDIVVMLTTTPYYEMGSPVCTQPQTQCPTSPLDMRTTAVSTVVRVLSESNQQASKANHAVATLLVISA